MFISVVDFVDSNKRNRIFMIIFMHILLQEFAVLGWLEKRNYVHTLPNKILSSIELSSCCMKKLQECHHFEEKHS